MTEQTRTAHTQTELPDIALSPDSADPALQPRLVVTDLDGSLLDHHSYDFSPAAPWLARLNSRACPLYRSLVKPVPSLFPLREALGLTTTHLWRKTAL